MAEKKFYVSAEELAQAYTELGSTIRVAERFNVSKKLILTYMKRFGIERNKKRPLNDLAEQIRVYKGYSSKELAEKLNTSLTTINRCIREFGIEIDRYHKGYIIDDKGYIHVRRPEHPNADKKGYIREHTLVMSEAIGRPIDDEIEVVHHKNRRKQDNRLCNLQLMTKREHKSLHAKEKRKKSLVV